MPALIRPKSRALRALQALLAAALSTGVLGACSSVTTSNAPTTTTSPTTTAPAAGGAASAPSGTVWLCRPGSSPDPCADDLTTVVTAADGSRSLQHPVPAANPPIDCFYVYPTVSSMTTINADLTVQPEETRVARAQASPFSQVCKVWAPMYRQLTLSHLFPDVVSPQYMGIAYADVQAAWLDYLAHYNHGRKVVLIGHSQGTFMLIALIHKEIDPNVSQRRLLLSAILAGGNVQVVTGSRTGGSFDHIPLCAGPTETQCVIAWSTFLDPPPSDSLFGRAGAGASLADAALGVPSPGPGQEVACVNPAGPGGSGPAPALPLLPTGHAASPWVEYPSLYAAHCVNSGGASWLQIDVQHGPGDPRPVVTQTEGPIWGLHVDDINIVLGNLVQLVRTESGQR